MNSLIKIGIALEIVAFVFEIWYLYTWLGGVGAAVGFILFPAVWTVLPFIMLFRSGIWFPLVITLLPFVLGFFKLNTEE